MYPAVPNAPSEDDIEDICIAAAVNSQSQQLQEPSSKPDSDIEYPPPPPGTIKLTVQTGVKLKSGKVLKSYVHKQGDDDVEMPELEGADLTAPFMTVGIGNQLIMKPINPGVLKDIIQGAPNPRTNPSACLMYLKRMCLGQNMTQIDIQLIINGILGYDSVSGWDWSRVPSISETDNGTGVGEAGSDGVYELSTSAGCAKMWDEVEAEMLRLWKNKQSISTALACKQGAKEEIGIFVKRFYKCWKDEAGLKSGDDMDLLKIQPCLGNMLPQYSLLVKQLISDWANLGGSVFLTEVIEKENAGCFDLRKDSGSKVAYYAQGLQHCPPTQARERLWDGAHRARGRGWRQGNQGYRGRGNQGGIDRNTCFNCGQHGHWRNECPHPRKPQPPQQPHNSQNTPGRQEQHQAHSQHHWPAPPPPPSLQQTQTALGTFTGTTDQHTHHIPWP
ncbi:hypothetical protein XELAEV_18041981mg [Pelobates cultripes]|uniref:CCHC-type domain-containing protein n=1 Tax=Pelobates cultripes TaxID=61616 RepID=A0AAD1RQX0_PELCU|nr:hypothetical protein XELAEV_18041981mg [Pelobates cultripes]